MEKYKLYKDDLAGEDGELRLGGEECSDEVISSWTKEDDPYEVEDVRFDASDPASIQYFALTGERVLFRKKVLSLPIDAVIEADANVLAAHPFVGSDCTVAELLDSNVKIAMAFVPLTSDDGVSGAVLARLYCVSGLSKQYEIPFESEIPPGANDYVWFLAGCPKRPRPMHESWHFAAGLLMSVLREANIQARENLATSFIVTGRVDWSTGRIDPVLMNQKVDVVNSEIRHLVWLMASQNEREITEMIKIECPANMADAYELIKTMQNHATKALVGCAKDGSLDGAVGMLKCKADPCQIDAEMRRNALQLMQCSIKSSMQSVYNNMRVDLHKRGISDDNLDAMFGELGDAIEKGITAEYSMAYYGCVPQMFFILAKHGCDQVVKELANVFDINATDSNGMTALDFAEEHGESIVASILLKNGADERLRGLYKVHSRNMGLALSALNSNSQDETAAKYLMDALEAGTSPNEEILFLDGLSLETWYRKYDPVYGSPEEADEDDEMLPSFDPMAVHDMVEYSCCLRRYVSSIFFEAILSKNLALVERCFAQGGDLERKIVFSNVQKISAKTYHRTKREADETFMPEFVDRDFYCRRELTIKQILSNRDKFVGACLVPSYRQKILGMAKKYFPDADKHSLLMPVASK